jgi:hypothetical protein
VPGYLLVPTYLQCGYTVWSGLPKLDTVPKPMVPPGLALQVYLYLCQTLGRGGCLPRDYCSSWSDWPFRCSLCLYRTRYTLRLEIQSLYSSHLIFLIFHQKYKNFSRFVGCISNMIQYSLVNLSSFPLVMCLVIRAPSLNFSLSIKYLIT